MFVTNNDTRRSNTIIITEPGGGKMEAICKADYAKRVKEKEAAEKEAERNRSVKAPQIGFHDIYGVWFFGNLCGVIREVLLNSFGVDQENLMHVFIDIEPDKIKDGTHDLTEYDNQCRLYKWKAQGYHRGLVVLTDDTWGSAVAQIYMESGTWSWVLNDEDKVKLPHHTNGRAAKGSDVGDGLCWVEPEGCDRLTKF